MPQHRLNILKPYVPVYQNHECLYIVNYFKLSWELKEDFGVNIEIMLW